MSWFKRYLIGFLIALVFFASADSYAHPGNDMRYGAILVASAGWPVFAAMIVGSTIGDVVHDVRQGKTG